jgi:hypothetical protein
MLATATDEEMVASTRRTRHILRIWSEITRIDLSAELVSRFRREADQLLLHTWPLDALRLAGSRVETVRGNLRLTEWADELMEPGTVVIASIPQRWHEGDDRTRKPCARPWSTC